MAFAVKARIGRGERPAAASRLRISAVVAKPSRSGIWQSISTRSKLSRSRAASASIPLPATVTRQFRPSSMFTATSWLTTLSSARSTRPEKATSWTAGAAAWPSVRLLPLPAR